MSRWLIRVLVAAAGLIVGGPSLARDGVVEKLEVIESGLYSAEVIGRTGAPATTAGFSEELRKVVYYDRAHRVPAQVGIRFGTRVLLVGSPTGRRANMRSVWRIPAPGVVNPGNGITYRESVADVWSLVGSQYSRGFHFNEPWQIVCGEWIQELWQGDRKLLSQTFIVEGCTVPISARESMPVVAIHPGGAAACSAG